MSTYTISVVYYIGGFGEFGKGIIQNAENYEVLQWNQTLTRYGFSLGCHIHNGTYLMLTLTLAVTLTLQTLTVTVSGNLTIPTLLTLVICTVVNMT